jgi:VanZ family protein
MRLLHWLPAVIQAGLIFYLSNQTSPPGADLGPDYILHGCGYLILGAAVAWGMSSGLRNALSRNQWLACWMLAVFYGALDEFHQSFIPGRDPSLSDLTADAVGAAVGVLLVLAASRMVRRLRS